MSALSGLYDASVSIAGHPITWREILGNAFGFASAVGGLRRRVWAWPVGIVGNALLFTVFLAATVEADAQVPLFGQAGRQVLFIAVSVYGWQRWRAARAAGAAGAAGAVDAAVTPRWATGRERTATLLAALAGVLVCQQLFAVLGAGWPAPRWYFWCDAWIFVGSVVATYAMARGWTDFWLAWIAVDAVGVPLLWHSGYYPTAVLYLVYGGLVIWGFVVWLRVARGADTPPAQGADPISSSTPTKQVTL
ncbi:nicotinamide riboside transporter PnuC [Nocardioides fonticola]|uniref:Nicotinamide riboside transporter PnuC n=1 Tax=Nocardioides fonticola TaxID=450363 RepID=A0ABP7XTV9_9ACTN